VSPRTIDYYTRIGLLSPLERTGVNYRLYGDECLERLDQIKRLQSERYSLGEIKEKLGVGANDTAPGQNSDLIKKVSGLALTLEQLQREVADLHPHLAQLIQESCPPEVMEIARHAVSRGLSLAQALLVILGDLPPGG